MPELPEVETIARGLAKRITGDVIESVWLGQKPEPLKSPAAEMAAVLEHSRIAAVRRIGKHIVVDLERTSVARALLRQAQGRLSPANAIQEVKAKSGRQRGKSHPTQTLSKRHAKADESVRPTPAPTQGK